VAADLRSRLTGPVAAMVVCASIAVFVATYVVAKTDYPEWMWLFVIAGLLLPWLAIGAVVVVVVARRLDPT
jgi:hypothetical protein